MHNSNENYPINRLDMRGSDDELKGSNGKSSEQSSERKQDLHKEVSVTPEQMDAMVKQFEENRQIRFEEDRKKDEAEVAALRAKLRGEQNKAVAFNLGEEGLFNYVKNAKINSGENNGENSGSDSEGLENSQQPETKGKQAA